MKLITDVVLAPFRLIQFWGIGMIKLWNNDLHPHPGVRAGIMIFLAVVMAASLALYPMLHRAGRGVEFAYGAGALLTVGLVSYLFNHRWRGAFF